MLSSAENILQNLFQLPLLADVSEDELKKLTETHPYFSAAQFLLAKKLYSLNEKGYERALQKTALHFPNVLWLNFKLNEKENNIIEEELKSDSNKILNDEDGKPTEDFTKADNAIHEKLSSMLQQQVVEFEQPLETTAIEVMAENTPYHRIDYFDSQGIKLEEEKATDKLGTQLKKFTDWLKQMKRINANPIDLGNDEAGEMQVKHIAEHSNEGETVITEAMADVLIKQGKPEQAIQIYQKLSFNNPSKSAYFAAKIEELKG